MRGHWVTGRAGATLMRGLGVGVARGQANADGGAGNTYQSHDSGTTGYQPWRRSAGTWAQGNAIAAYQDAILTAKGGGGELAALVGNGVNGGAMAAAYRSQDGGASWSLVGTYTSAVYSENAIATPPANGVCCWPNDDQWVEITFDGNTAPTSIRTSRDGGQTWVTPAQTGFGGGWISTPTTTKLYRVHSRAGLIVVCHVPSTSISTTVCKVSTDGGNTWTTLPSTYGGISAVEWDSVGGVWIALLKAGLFSAGSYTYPGPVLVYTSTNLAGPWTQRQSIATSDTTLGTDTTNLRVSAGAVYASIKQTTSGWTTYRSDIGTWKTTNPLGQVHQPAGTNGTASIGTVKAFADLKMRYPMGANVYVSGDGKTWATETTGNVAGIGQLAVLR